jgi:hypothetical protein
LYLLNPFVRLNTKANRETVTKIIKPAAPKDNTISKAIDIAAVKNNDLIMLYIINLKPPYLLNKKENTARNCLGENQKRTPKE